ncbi:hypothetical protein SUGI_0375590 [Cryptomeria japonica]|uniref:GRAS family protein RAM1-like n=1 Tax=Cryptomeria japonica TaxID=3369 RepID=UPI0024089FA3|nr:GRAS family protein RAM1-like [Cryptomeria japonica]GLJ20621.1 hypothetical protein SUGI_0375590 [Cryptomeria japonica]
MVVSNNGIPPLSIADYSVSSFLFESDVSEGDQYLAMAMEDTFVVADCEMFPFGEELIGHNLFEIIPFEEEQINDYEAESSLTVDDIFTPEGQLHDEMLPNEDILFSEQIPNFEGAQPIRICAHGGFNHEVRQGEKKEEMELVQLLLASGRMIGDGKYDQADRLVSKCKSLSRQLGSPTQRLAYYISGALQDRIHRQTHGMLNNAAKPVSDFAFNIEGEFDQNELCSLVAYFTTVLPYTKLLQFTSVQAIIDTVGDERKIHIIDLGMRSGSHWTVLMEYLAHRVVSSSFAALELLRITAVGMNGQELKKSRRRLHELAKSLGIPFTYSIVEIPNIEEIKHGLFTVKSGEALAVYSSFILRSLLYDPVVLANLLIVINKLRPRIMVNVEVEAQHNSPCFVNRLSEVLFHYMAYFDLLDVTLTDRNDIKRLKHEELITGSQIRNMIVYEGKERSVRHVRSDVWRCLFKQAGFREKSFSFQAMYQARLLLEEYASGEYYTLKLDGHAIIVRWKGTPFFSLSAWTGTK